MQIGADSVSLTLTLTLDLFNPKLIDFDTVSRTAMPSFKSVAHCDQGFSFYRANTHPHSPAYIHTHIVTK